MKRAVAIADRHSGHPTGLCPPAWQFKRGQSEERDRIAEYQEESWQRYADIRKKIGPADVLFDLGDQIDGRETGRHLVSEDREDQGEMSKECLKIWKPKKTVMVYGTPRHSGKLEKWESIIAKSVGAEIASREFINVDKVSFKLRHKISRSSLPHLRGTALLREALKNEISAARGKDPLAKVLLFAHTHYFSYAGNAEQLAMTLPSLQGESEYGAMEVDDDVNWGVVWFEVDGDQYDWHREIITLETSKPKVIQL